MACGFVQKSTRRRSNSHRITHESRPHTTRHSHRRRCIRIHLSDALLFVTSASRSYHCELAAAAAASAAAVRFVESAFGPLPLNSHRPATMQPRKSSFRTIHAEAVGAASSAQRRNVALDWTIAVAAYCHSCGIIGQTQRRRHARNGALIGSSAMLTCMLVCYVSNLCCQWWVRFCY
jgi:hypothetical protein